MDSKVVDRRELDVRNNPEVLSSPIVKEPIYQCAIAVTVISYVADAKIEVEVDGSSVASVPGGAGKRRARPLLFQQGTGL